MDGKMQEEYEDRLQQALEELRDVYDKQMQQNRDDFAKIYDDRVSLGKETMCCTNFWRFYDAGIRVMKDVVREVFKNVKNSSRISRTSVN